MNKKPINIGLFAVILMVLVSAAAHSRVDLHDFAKNFSDDDMEIAASRNSELKNSLRWTFGRKPQVGWYLYSDLLRKTLKTEANVDSEEFAEEVASWQRRNRIASNGVIDRNTLLSFIKHWQSQRIRPIRVAPEESLRSAPISDFFDQTRDRDLLRVEKETYRAYKNMIAAAINDKVLTLQTDSEENLSSNEKYLKIISSFRSPEYQASLRKKEPNAGRAQIAVNSPHFTGRALDIYVGGEPVTSKDSNRAIQVETPAYKWLVKNAGKFGFVPYFFEPWHWEYAPENIKSD
ncbi:MAG: D-alanyl-D-alanine carboxypeptidase family protein [Pyrinomonadaceae bacterium]